MRRAFFTRFEFPENVEVWPCKGHEFIKGQASCDSSIFWNKNQIHGVIVNGKKQGCIKKHFGTSKAESEVCRKRISQFFYKSFQNYFKKDIITYEDLKNECSLRSPFYATNKEKLLKHNLKTKTNKNNFRIQ